MFGWVGGLVGRWVGRQAGRQAGKQTDRQTDRRIKIAHTRIFYHVWFTTLSVIHAILFVVEKHVDTSVGV